MTNDFYEPDPREALELKEPKVPYIMSTSPDVSIGGVAMIVLEKRAILYGANGDYRVFKYETVDNDTFEEGNYYKELNEGEVLLLLMLNNYNDIMSAVELRSGKEMKYV